MSEKISVYVIGNGGHAKVIRSILKQKPDMDFAGFVEEKDEDDFLTKNKGKETKISLAIGIGENSIRQKLYDKFAALGYAFPIIQSVQAAVVGDTKIGAGTVIMPGAIINADACIGKACVINSGAIIEHDVQMDDFASAAPGSVVSGGCSVGEGAYIGANATMIQNKKIGRWSVLGAGAALISDLEANVMAAGVPAIKKKSNYKN